MVAGEDIILMVAGVVTAMLGMVFGDEGFWGKIIGCLLIVIGLAMPYLGRLIN